MTPAARDAGFGQSRSPVGRDVGGICENGIDGGLRPATFRDLPGWDEDDHAAAFRAYLKSLDVLAGGEFGEGGEVTAGVARARWQAITLGRAGVCRSAARAFFEHFFRPYGVFAGSSTRLLTGYFEPILHASRTRQGRFRWPLHRRPPELETVIDDALRGAADIGLTHMRRLPDGASIPCYTRAEIDGGALAGRALELVWLDDPIDAFFTHVQGSARVRFADGAEMRISYDGKNGHPYTSIGRYLIETGEMSAAEMSLAALRTYLAADPVRAAMVMQQNASYVFFKALAHDAASAARGARDIPLTPGRSLAVDGSRHRLGTPIFVSAPALRSSRGRPLRRLMVAQDVGSAIRGPVRGDVFYGAGARAGALAGRTRHQCSFHVLLPVER